MEKREYTEHDWKLFCSKISDWQEAYMGKLNREYIELLSGNGSASDQFWELEKRVRTDKKKAGVQVEMRRSDLIKHILQLLSEEAISFADLDGFSDEMKNTVRGFSHTSS